VDGQNISIESRFAFGSDWRLDELAASLVRHRVDVIVAHTPQDLQAAMGFTRSIPIVMTYTGDPVVSGIVDRMERPGGNVTGIGGLASGLGGKWLEILKETLPIVTRVGVLYTQVSEKRSPMMRELQATAHSLRVDLQTSTPRYSGPGPLGRAGGGLPTGIDSGFNGATRGEVDGLIVLPALVFDRYLAYLAQLALQRRIPTIFWRSDFVDAGGFMSYGASETEQSRRAAYFVDKILKGAKPAEIPVEVPKKFEWVVNLKTAKEIGISVPPRVLAWADRVIK
jgi:putative ABC transport system substrate-binding protein